MALVLTSAPALEPVTVSEAKAHLRVDGTAEDTLIGSLILTSRLHIEAALGLALITQGWRLKLDRWPKDGAVELPLGPVQAVTDVRVLDGAGVAQTVPPESYVADVASSPARIVPRGAWPVPGQRTNGIEIDFSAGFGAAAGNVPAPVRQALLLLVAHWYEHRDPIEVGSKTTAIPAAVSNLLMPYRAVRL
ncbi:head-tail connector protein [Hyphomicrobium sp. D-2]|uniref:head-tail connector protein n=1 Tax=Hyphomicrobium sp. D-2 TaxID=3041621 RepID=UPI002454A520|nr:head-tail connector protein [Hyphomicrobium sp. D-2]MDH4981297.1 head-tail connector protein [Hyphomicrobium sp. D-2]